MLSALICCVLSLAGCEFGNGEGGLIPDHPGGEASEEAAGNEKPEENSLPEADEAPDGEVFDGKASDAEASDAEAEERERNGVLRWINGFCDRDPEVIMEMAQADALSSLEETGLLRKESGYAEFGWSSPYPVDYRLLNCGDGKATVLYYAWSSDPHMSVWREELEYRESDDGITVEKENLRMFDEIDNAEDFFLAYPDGLISGTPMDYLVNEELSHYDEAAAAHKGDGDEYYDALFSPETAVCALLNLSKNPEDIRVAVPRGGADEGTLLQLLFEKDGTECGVEMIRISSGAWVPGNAGINLNNENLSEDVMILRDDRSETVAREETNEEQKCLYFYDSVRLRGSSPAAETINKKIEEGRAAFFDDEERDPVKFAGDREEMPHFDSEWAMCHFARAESVYHDGKIFSVNLRDEFFLGGSDDIRFIGFTVDLLDGHEIFLPELTGLSGDEVVELVLSRAAAYFAENNVPDASRKTMEEYLGTDPEGYKFCVKPDGKIYLLVDKYEVYNNPEEVFLGARLSGQRVIFDGDVPLKTP